MFRNKPKKYYPLGLFVLSLFLVCLFFIGLKSIRAEKSDCDLLSGDDKKECKELEEKAEEYKKLIEIKDKEGDTLKNQVELLNIEQEKNQVEYNLTKKEAEILQQQIELIEKEIIEKEERIEYYKKILGALLQSYYEDYRQGMIDISILDENFNELLKNSDYADQSADKLKEVLNEIRSTKEKLEKEQDELFEKKKKNEEIKEKLKDKLDNIQANENKKKSILYKTQGEEEKYRELLKRVEEQKLELFNFGEATNLQEILDSVKNYPKPDSKYWASTSWYYAQHDSRWGNKKIGNSKTLMKDYGCAVTSVAMVFKKHGASVTPGYLAGQEMYYYDLIQWPGSWSPGIKLESSINHGNIKWSTVDDYIEKDSPVIVYIKRSKGGGHYVVIHNKDSKDYIVHDPYFGANLYLGTSKSLVGKIGTNSNVSIDQMIVYDK